MIHCLLIALALNGAPAYAADSAVEPAEPGKPKAELQTLRSQIDSLQQELQQNEATKAEARDALQASEQAISNANRLLAELSSAQAATQAQLQQYRARLSSRQQQTRNAQRQLAGLLRSQYQSRPASNAARLLLGTGDPTEAARHLKYYQFIARAQQDAIAKLQHEMAELDSLVTEITRREQQLTQIRQQKAAQKSALQQQKQTRQQTLQQISTEISAQRNQIARLKEDEKRLSRLIDQLNRLMEQRQRAEQQRLKAARLAGQRAAKLREKRARTAQAGVAGKPAANAPPAETARPQQGSEIAASGQPLATLPAGAAFNSLRGRLLQPVSGEIINRFGSNRAEGAGTWKGMFLRTRTGEEIRSIANGQVVFADWLRGFGNLIIVDHGQGYMSLYGHNEALLRQVGATLKAGDIIARAGNSGGNAETGLYFEIRHRGAPLDPAQWVRFP